MGLKEEVEKIEREKCEMWDKLKILENKGFITPSQSRHSFMKIANYYNSLMVTINGVIKKLKKGK